MEYTHFISLPLAIHQSLREKLTTFQECVLAATNASNAIQDHLEKSIFISPETFHLTVLMLRLHSEERVKAAAEVLQRALPQVYSALEGRYVAINIKGLKCMENNLAKAHVVYACIEEDDNGNRLLRACEAIIDAFKGAGLVPWKDQGRRLKLHSTVINTRHRDMTNASFQESVGTCNLAVGIVPARNVHRRFFLIGKCDKAKRIPIDAREILCRYGSQVWGQYPITEAHLSELGNYDDNGYYHCCSSVQFPLPTTSSTYSH